MAIKVPVSIEVISANPIDSRFVLSQAEMRSVIDAKMPKVYFAVCSDNGNLYTYNKDNEVDPTTGKYRLVETDIPEIVLDEKSITKNSEGQLEIFGFSAVESDGKFLHKKADGSGLEWADFKIETPIERTTAEPLDSSYSWNTLSEALQYANTSNIAYVGQILYVKEDGNHYKITDYGLVKLTNDQIIQLYNELGDHTDGAITQKAISEIINEINEKITQINEKIDKKIEASIEGDTIYFK